MPQISVIVPVYKVEPYLHRCVDSILGQTFTDFELILVDDGSPDGCPAICDEYAKKDSRVHVIHQKNGGLSAARNAGIDWAFANSDSQWLTFVDSDDWVRSDYLHQLLQICRKTNCIVGVCGLWRTDETAIPDTPAERPQRVSVDDFYCELAGDKISPAAACGKLFCKSLFKSLRFPLDKLHEDEFTTYLALYEAEHVGLCATPLYAYFRNANGIMQSKWTPRRFDAVEAYEQQLRFAQLKGNSRLYSRVLELYILNLTLQHIQVLELSAHTENVPYATLLQKKLRRALRKAKRIKLFHPSEQKNMWIHYQAYPIEMKWRSRLQRIMRKTQ